MKCCDIIAGHLRVPVTIEGKTRVPDGYGGSTDEWQEVATPRTKWRHASMGERLQAMAVQSRVMHTVWMRYRSDIKPEMRMIDPDGAVYNIRGVVDVEKRRRFLELSVEENAPN